MHRPQYRFFFHYNKAKNTMTVHFRNKCIVVKHIRCDVPVETKWNKAQPRIVMRGWCHAVQLNTETDTAHIT